VETLLVVASVLWEVPLELSRCQEVLQVELPLHHPLKVEMQQELDQQQQELLALLHSKIHLLQWVDSQAWEAWADSEA
jgi:hypothetical protein